MKLRSATEEQEEELSQFAALVSEDPTMPESTLSFSSNHGQQADVSLCVKNIMSEC